MFFIWRRPAEVPTNPYLVTISLTPEIHQLQVRQDNLEDYRVPCHIP